MEPPVRLPGSSIKVPIVQELAKEVSSTVPPRYVCPDLDSVVFSGQSEVPILDMKLLLDGDSTDMELHKLHNACKQWGFFQVCSQDSIINY